MTFCEMGRSNLTAAVFATCAWAGARHKTSNSRSAPPPPLITNYLATFFENGNVISRSKNSYFYIIFNNNIIKIFY